MKPKPVKTDSGVWVIPESGDSVARSFVVAGMRAHWMNEHDFRLRDKLIMAVAPILERDLDERQEREQEKGSHVL
jgi:hypothetical protein